MGQCTHRSFTLALNSDLQQVGPKSVLTGQTRSFPRMKDCQQETPHMPVICPEAWWRVACTPCLPPRSGSLKRSPWYLWVTHTPIHPMFLLTLPYALQTTGEQAALVNMTTAWLWISQTGQLASSSFQNNSSDKKLIMKACLF